MAAEASAAASSELQVSLLWLMQKAEEARSKAMELGQPAGAVAAIKELGILSGHRIEKRENTNRTIGDLTDDELARIALSGGDGDLATPERQAKPH